MVDVLLCCIPHGNEVCLENAIVEIYQNYEQYHCHGV